MATRDLIKSKRSRIAVVAVGLLLIAGLGATAKSTIFASGSPDTDVPYQFSQSLGHSTAAGAGQTIDSLAQTILSRYGGKAVVSVKVGDPPNADQPSGSWLNFVARAPAGYGTTASGWQAESIRSAWETDLVAGAIGDAASERNLGHVAGSTISGVQPDGTTVTDLGGGIGAVPAGQAFSGDSATAVTTNVKSALTASGLDLVSADVLHADQPAPAVVAQTTDPAKAAANAQATVNSLFGGHPPTYEGYYLEVRDSTGNPVYVVSFAYRAASGRQWVDPAFASKSSLGHL
jgi:hypothetical protein